MVSSPSSVRLTNGSAPRPDADPMVRALLESCPAVAYMKDLQGRYTMINDEAARFLAQFGRSRDEALGKTDREIFPPEVAAAFAQAEHKVLTEATPLQVEEHSPRDHSSLGTWRLSIRFPLRDRTGALCGLAGVCADITGHKELEAQLARRADLLEQQARDLTRANNDLRDFAHIAAHDLQEPLRGMRLSLGMLREDAADRLSGEDQQRIDSIDRLALRMHELLDALLRYSRLSRVKIHPVPTNLGAIVNEVVHSLHAPLSEHHARVELPDDGLPNVLCDPALIAQVFSNLILNGIKYNNSPEKVIRISGALVGDSPVIRVSDNGIGIRPDNFGLIFQMFRRLNPGRFGEGTGAGLAFSKKIIESHGGQIWLESEPGRGTTFYFTLAQPPEHGPAHEPMPASNAQAGPL
jgi:PAS domain S-box-containing protein